MRTDSNPQFFNHESSLLAIRLTPYKKIFEQSCLFFDFVFVFVGMMCNILNYKFFILWKYLLRALPNHNSLPIKTFIYQAAKKEEKQSRLSSNKADWKCKNIDFV